MPQLNSEDIQIISNARKRNFKYAFIDDYHREVKSLRYSNDGIDEFEYLIEYLVLSPEFAEINFDESDWEYVYEGDRDSPPEYSIKDDAEAYSVIEVFQDDADCMVLTYSDFMTIHLFNTIESLKNILGECNLSIFDICNDGGIIDVYPENLRNELFNMTNYDVTVDEIKELFY